MKLNAHLAHRNNGLTLLRLILAVQVLIGHAYETGGFGPDPLHRLFGVTMGELAVNSFFAISGYLVTSSWLRSKSAFDYFKKRFLRILPGFWVCLLVVGFGLLPWLLYLSNGSPWPASLLNPEFTGYVWKNAALKINQSYAAGLFAGHPSPYTINGSLWTLFPEFLCYIGVAVLGSIGLTQPRRKYILLSLALTIYLAQAIAPLVWSRFHLDAYPPVWLIWRITTQATYFAAGMIIHAWADRITVNKKTCGLLFSFIVLGAWAGLYAWTAPLFLPLFILMISAFFPRLLQQEIGDYSYGIYIYNHPVQQALYSLNIARDSLLNFILISLLCVLPLAFLSWRLIEQPALRLKPTLPR